MGIFIFDGNLIKKNENIFVIYFGISWSTLPYGPGPI